MRTILIACICMLTFSAFAQPTYNYATALSSNGTLGIFSYSTATDAKGNVYVCGLFTGTVDFDPGAGTANLTVTGNSNAYVVKYNAAGTYQWAFNIPTTGTNGGSFYKVTTDLNGNIYVAGTANTGTLDFDPSSNTANIISAANNTNVCANYDGNKSPSDPAFYQWAFTYGISSISSFQNYNMMVDKDNSLYLIGEYAGATDFDPSANTTTLPGIAGIYSMFIAKYDATKQPTDVTFLKWARSNTYNNTSGSTTNARCGAKNIGLDASGNVYVSGSYYAFSNVCVNSTTCDFSGTGVAGATFTSAPPLNGSCPSASYSLMYDAFVIKYNSAGVFQYVISIGDIYDEAANGMVVEPSGDFYLTGYYGGNNTNIANTVDFDPGAGTASLSDDGKGSMYIAKYSAAGGYQWAKRIACNAARYAATPREMVRDPANNIYIAGDLFDTNIDFDPDAGTNILSTAGNYDIFVAKYNSTGNHQWAFRVGGTLEERGKGIALDLNGNPVISGYFKSTGLDFDPGAGSTNLSAAGAVTTTYLAGYKQCDAGFDKWNGTTSNAWNTAGNWCYNAAPASLQVAVIQSGSSNNPVQVSSPQNIIDLVLQPGTSLNIAAAMNLSGTATNAAGTITIASGNTLTAARNLNNIGTIKGSGTITGNVYNLNTGIISPGTSPGILNITGNLICNKGSKLYMELAGTGAAGAVNGYDRFAITGSASLSDTLEIVFTYWPSPGASFTVLTAGSISGTFSSLKLPSNVTGTLTYNATSVVFNITGVLPLNILSFTAQKQNSIVLCNWSTTNEVNTSHFNIQKSIDGLNFINEGKINANNRSGINNYSFADYVAGINAKAVFYRLQMADKDGRSTYSKVVKINLDGKASISISPNPAKDHIFITGEAASIELFDVNGKQVLSQKLNNASTYVSISNLSKGMYIVRLKDALGNMQNEKLIIE